MNYATEIACGIVANGDIVEFGDLGTLSPSFKSKVVPVGEVFNVQKHIEKPGVRLSRARKYFMNYEQTDPKAKKGTKPAPKPNKGGGSSGDEGLSSNLWSDYFREGICFTSFHNRITTKIKRYGTSNNKSRFTCILQWAIRENVETHRQYERGTTNDKICRGNGICW